MMVEVVLVMTAVTVDAAEVVIMNGDGRGGTDGGGGGDGSSRGDGRVMEVIIVMMTVEVK